MRAKRGLGEDLSIQWHVLCVRCALYATSLCFLRLCKCMCVSVYARVCMRVHVCEYVCPGNLGRQAETQSANYMPENGRV